MVRSIKDKKILRTPHEPVKEGPLVGDVKRLVYIAEGCAVSIPGSAPVKDRKDYPLDTLHTHETGHRSCPPTHFDETSLHHIRRPQGPPEEAWAVNEGRQLWQVLQQPHDELWVRTSPPPGEGVSLCDDFPPT